MSIWWDSLSVDREKRLVQRQNELKEDIAVESCTRSDVREAREEWQLKQQAGP